MDIFEIRLYKDESDFDKRITCYVERVKGSKKEIDDKAKELAKRFNVNRWEIKKLIKLEKE